ncbi:MAG TPA: peptidylprolyl isomerase [Candidatus Dormibacteraeota bacterium]|jgi:cyclophilin family peptidyl-prolyl cis-trans isomerase
MSEPRGPQTRLPLLIGSAAVVVIAIVAIAFGVNNASAPLPAVPTAKPTAKAPTPTPSPTAAATFAFADCSTAKFGPVLKPINPPASVHTYSAAPPVTINLSKLYQATIATAKGDIVLCLQPELAPNTVNVFVTLARNHFYDGNPFHRVVAGFVIQAGDPNCAGHVPVAPATPSGSCGNGGPGFQFNDEPVHQSYVAGCVAMANSGANTNGSQFFICTANDSSLPKSYNLFGKVESGMPVALKIAQGDVITSITVREQI